MALVKSFNPTQTSITSSTSNQTLLAANTTRLGLIIYNESTAVLYVKLGVTASTTSYTWQIAAGGVLQFFGPVMYCGEIDGVWASANGFARITELN